VRNLASDASTRNGSSVSAFLDGSLSVKRLPFHNRAPKCSFDLRLARPSADDQYGFERLQPQSQTGPKRSEFWYTPTGATQPASGTTLR
jgi:hypothetical protein